MKYLTFLLGDRLFGIELNSVRELLGYMPFTPLFGQHPAIVGCFNLRGSATRVLDLRLRLGLPAARTDETVMLVAEWNGETVALITDNTRGIQTIPQLSSAAPSSMRIDSRFVQSVVQTPDSQLTLLDLAAVLSILPQIPKAA